VSHARAAIDIGSNTLRLMIAEPAALTPPWRLCAYESRITRLGEGLRETGLLQETAMQRVIAGLKEFSDLVRIHGIAPQNVAAVATAAVREATNGDLLLNRIKASTGISPRKISGDEEAGLSLQGAAAVLLDQYSHDLLLMDIGGGSTEFIRAGSGRLQSAISRKLGVVALVNAGLGADPPSAAEYNTLLDRCRSHLQKVEASWPDHRIPATLAGTAGTVTTLAGLHLNLFPYDADRINNHAIGWNSFLKLRGELLAMTHQERAALPAIESGRADLIIAGVAIVEAVMDQWHYSELITVDAGLLEGVWLNASPPIYGSGRGKGPQA